MYWKQLSGHAEVAVLLYKNGGLVCERGELVEIEVSELSPISSFENLTAIDGTSGLTGSDGESITPAYTLEDNQASQRDTDVALKVLKKLKRTEIKDNWEISKSDVILEEKVGAGAFGDVYRAKWRGAVVAVKVGVSFFLCACVCVRERERERENVCMFWRPLYMRKPFWCMVLSLKHMLSRSVFIMGRS